MKKHREGNAVEHVVKKTTIGNGRISTSSMNKHKRRSFKKYRGQGKRRWQKKPKVKAL